MTLFKSLSKPAQRPDKNRPRSETTLPVRTGYKSGRGAGRELRSWSGHDVSDEQLYRV